MSADIARVLALHQWYDATTDKEDAATRCTGCDDWFGDDYAVDDGTFAAHQAAVLAPLILRERAEALREAAADGWADLPGGDWLRARAAAIDPEGAEE